MCTISTTALSWNLYTRWSVLGCIGIQQFQFTGSNRHGTHYAAANGNTLITTRDHKSVMRFRWLQWCKSVFTNYFQVPLNTVMCWPLTGFLLIVHLVVLNLVSKTHCCCLLLIRGHQSALFIPRPHDSFEKKQSFQQSQCFFPSDVMWFLDSPPHVRSHLGN